MRRGRRGRDGGGRGRGDIRGWRRVGGGSWRRSWRRSW